MPTFLDKFSENLRTAFDSPPSENLRKFIQNSIFQANIFVENVPYQKLDFLFVPANCNAKFEMHSLWVSLSDGNLARWNCLDSLCFQRMQLCRRQNRSFTINFGATLLQEGLYKKANKVATVSLGGERCPQISSIVLSGGTWESQTCMHSWKNKLAKQLDFFGASEPLFSDFNFWPRFGFSFAVQL